MIDNADFVKVLIQYGADVNACDASKRRHFTQQFADMLTMRKY